MSKWTYEVMGAGVTWLTSQTEPYDTMAGAASRACEMLVFFAKNDVTISVRLKEIKDEDASIHN